MRGMQADKLAELVEQVPALDKNGTLTGPRWDPFTPTLDAILALGKEGATGLLAMLRDVDDGQDYKARYLVHVLAVYLGRPGKEAERSAYAAALAQALDGDRPKGVKGYLARQLQVCGGAPEAPALGRLLADEENCEYAAQALLALRAGAAEEFRKALPAAKGRCRLTIVQALGTLRDAESAEALRALAADPDLGLAALRGLARIGDAASVDAVLKAADAPEGTARIKAVHIALLLAENLAAAGKKDAAAKIWSRLRDTRTEPHEAYVREAAERALGG